MLYHVITTPCSMHSNLNGEILHIELTPVTGIEPVFSELEADVLPLHYTGIFGWKGRIRTLIN
jgi:hypothetical protein